MHIMNTLVLSTSCDFQASEPTDLVSVRDHGWCCSWPAHGSNLAKAGLRSYFSYIAVIRKVAQKAGTEFNPVLFFHREV